jgi:signal transduction histidine kinase
MTEGQPAEAPAADFEKRRLSLGDNPLVRAVGRLPVRVHIKLLVAFAATALLAVGVGLLGLRVLGQENERAKSLGALEARAVAYGELQQDALHLRLLLAENAAGSLYRVSNRQAFKNRRSAAPSGREAIGIDRAVADTAARIGPATLPTSLGFRPSVSDETVLRRIRAKSGRLVTVMRRIIASDPSATTVGRQLGLRQRAAQLGIDLSQLGTDLADATTAKTDAVIVQSASSYSASRALFSGVAFGAIVLALLLGLVLSWSLIGPIQRINARLAAIASGDFSGHVNVPNRDELGALAANLNRMNDELRRLYGELETASRHKSEFLATMSHELRTPLNAIIGFSEVLQQQMFGELNERQVGYVNDVLAAGKHLLSLINDVLDLTKIEAGRMELEPSQVAIPDILRSAVSMHAERASRGGIELNLTTEPEEITISADERRVRQIVFNLLSNAIKFTPPDGRIDVSAQLEDGRVEVGVADTGPGIAANDLETIFEEFEQTSQGKLVEGTGLGLPLSRKLVELHGGRLWVDSEVGRGSTFRFTLPIRQEMP